MIILIIFWLLLLLAFLGLFADAEKYPNLVRRSGVIYLILIGILGYKIFGNPLDK